MLMRDPLEFVLFDFLKFNFVGYLAGNIPNLGNAGEKKNKNGQGIWANSQSLFFLEYIIVNFSTSKEWVKIISI